jgi:hypothetical protein
LRTQPKQSEEEEEEEEELFIYPIPCCGCCVIAQIYCPLVALCVRPSVSVVRGEWELELFVFVEGRIDSCADKQASRSRKKNEEGFVVCLNSK